MDDDAAKRLVRDGYNQISHSYRGDTIALGTHYPAWINTLTAGLSDGDPVLDLGCGNGLPVSRLLSERFTVTGVDISDMQVQRARRLVPRATFHRADMTEIELPPASFTAVVSLFALIHLPVAQQPPMIQRIAGWLRRGGHLLATVGHTAWTGIDQNWHGGRMYWSQADAATYARWLDQVGFDIVQQSFIPEGETGHELFLAIRAQ
jgi:cyclopropane fatty-acyl-phospholipid synthase-like methyltransferase